MGLYIVSTGNINHIRYWVFGPTVSFIWYLLRTIFSLSVHLDFQPIIYSCGIFEVILLNFLAKKFKISNSTEYIKVCKFPTCQSSRKTKIKSITIMSYDR